MTEHCEVAVIGSGFAGSLMARVLAVLGYHVVLLERGTHPRFAIGESTTPLANLSLERLARRYDLPDCYQLAAHGRWLEHHPGLRRGLKRGFTFYRHHPDGPLDGGALAQERLLVAASPNDAVSDTHWLRADVDHHFVREAIAAGVDYRDRVDVRTARLEANGVLLGGEQAGEPFELLTNFIIDASGPTPSPAGDAKAWQFGIPSGLKGTFTRSGILFSHFTNVALVSDAFPQLPKGPYPDDWAAVHHVIDEGWMYSLRFDDGVTSAGFALTPKGQRAFNGHADASAVDPNALWQRLLGRYPTIGALFGGAKPLFPLRFQPAIQHRRARAVCDRCVLLPHAYAFVDPLFSTGIAWSLRAIERLALLFEPAQGRRKEGQRLPRTEDLARYDALLAKEADQIDRIVAGAYEAMAHFDLFAAQAMIYFTAVSFAETRQRLLPGATPSVAWSGFLGVDDPALATVPGQSLRRLRRITRGSGCGGTPKERLGYVDWVRQAVAPRNLGGFAEPERHNLYPVDLDLLVNRHALLGMTHEQLLAALPALRGMGHL